MAFITLPIYFSEDDYEAKENLKLPVDRNESNITINTNQICAFHANDAGNLMIRMSNGEIYESPVPIEDFVEAMDEVESLSEISRVSNN